MKIIFIFSCSGMFRNVPECSGMFRNVPCSGFSRRPIRKPLDRYNVRIMHVENLLTFSNSQYQIDEVNHDKIFQ